ncbi:hypothetical protein WT05_15620 [Burkholderia stagnalis]|nr:hypothetical protein WT05_15620 [Burkholderia stagnalis]
MPAQVGPYPGLTPGDRVDLYWGDAQSPVATEVVAASHDGLSSLTVPVPRDAILAAGDGMVEVFYRVHDRAGNWADSARVKLAGPGGPDRDPSTPWLNEQLAPPELPVEVIGAAKEADGLVVTIPPWPAMAESDELTLSWGTQRVQGPTLTADQVGQPVELRVERAIVEAAGDDAALAVTYRVRDVVNNRSGWSPAATVAVTLDPRRLAAPQVVAAVDHQLDLAALGAHDVQVELHDSQLAAGDAVTLTWHGSAPEDGLWGAPVIETVSATVLDEARVVRLAVPHAAVAARAPGRAVLWYEMTPAYGGLALVSARTTLTVTGPA